MYIESLVKRNTCGLLVPITANEARTLSDTPPVAHASSLTTYGLSASGIYGHVKPAESLPLSNSGIGSVGVAVSIFARADHRHPEITSVLQASRLVRGSLVGLGGGVIAPAVEFTGESDLILQVSHVNSDYLEGLIPFDCIPTGTTSSTVAAGNHTHNYAGSATAGGAATTALACTGNAATATKLATPRTISLSGSVTGSVSFDGSGDVSITTTTNHTHSYLPLSGGTVSGELKVGTSRQFIVNRSGAYGSVFIQGSTAGWAFAYCALGSEGTYLGGFGFFGNTDTLSRYYIGIYSSDEKISILSNGNVGIGNTSPSTKLDVNGTVTASSFSGVGASLTSLNASNLSSGTVPIARLPVGTKSTEVAYGDHTHLYAGSATAGGPATTAVTATNISGGTVSCTTLSASSTSSLVGNVGIGTSSIINSKLYVFLDKSISSTGSYYGQYNNAKFSTSIASGTRHGTGLYCLTEATGGTLTKLNCIDSKIIIASGSTAEDTFGICTSLFLDGGSTGTYYGLYMGREGTSTPDTYNYGIYQADSEATNIFKGYCRFEGGTNIDGGAGGRVRNFRVMSGTGTINHVKGTDTLVLYSNDGEYGSLGNKTLTLPLGSNNVETGDLIWVYFCGGDTLFFTTSTPNKIKKFTYDSNAQNFIMSTWRNEGSFPVIIHCLWDGEFWRLSYCALGI
jgi:hypothetical protein